MMKEAILSSGVLTENDTVYRTDKQLIDVYKEDCVCVTNPYCVSYFYKQMKNTYSAIYAENLKNIVVDFSGATLHLNGMLQPMAFYRCDTLKICNVNIEYDRGLFSEATVLEVTEKYARVHFSDEFPCRVENGRLIPYGKYWEDDHLSERQMFFQFFNAVTGDGEGISLGIVGPKLSDNQDLCFNPTQYIAEQAGNDVIFRPAKANEKINGAWKVGSTLVIEHGGRFYPGIVLQSCKNVMLENIRLINTNSMGILPLHCENIYIRGLRLMQDDKSHGILTNSADAIHGITNSGDFVIEDSIFENMMDDALNVHGQFQLITACKENRITVKTTSHEITQYCNLADVGDEIAIYRENTMVRRSVHHVVGCRVLDFDTAELTLDSAPENICVNDLVENLTGNCKLTLRRCRFAKANTHLRFQTRNRILVEDCVTELPFLFTGDATFWFESGPCCDVTIKNTYFVKARAIINACPEVRACQEEPYYHKHINVENCMFLSDMPMEMRYADDIHFRANRNILGHPMTVRLTNCGTIDAPDCKIERISTQQMLSTN